MRCRKFCVAATASFGLYRDPLRAVRLLPACLLLCWRRRRGILADIVVESFGDQGFERALLSDDFQRRPCLGWDPNQDVPGPAWHLRGTCILIAGRIDR